MRFELLMRETSVGFNPRFRLLGGDGAIRNLAIQSPWNPTFGPLSPAHNPYRIELFDAFDNAGGTYMIRLQRLAAVPGCDQDAAWVCGTDTLELDSPIDSDLFTLVFRDGTPIDICVTPLGPSLQPIWRLVDVDGREASSCGTFRSGCASCGPIATGAPFRIEVIESGLNSSGAYVISVSCDPTDTSEDPSVTPRNLLLHSNVPNPFNPSTTVGFEIPAEGETKLQIFALSGRSVAVLVDRRMPAGKHLLRWNATGLSSGLYVTQLTWNGQVRSGKLTIVR